RWVERGGRFSKGAMRLVRASLVIVLLCASAQPATLSSVVSEYCVACHNARNAESGVALDALDSEKPWADAETWERFLRQLRARTMPPTDNPRPDSKTYEAL